RGEYGGIASRTSEKEIFSTIRKGTANSTSSHNEGTPATIRFPGDPDMRCAILLCEHQGTGGVPGQVHLLASGNAIFRRAYEIRSRHTQHSAGLDLHQVHGHVTQVGDFRDAPPHARLARLRGSLADADLLRPQRHPGGRPGRGGDTLADGSHCPELARAY